jgi:hypothetical protein
VHRSCDTSGRPNISIKKKLITDMTRRENIRSRVVLRTICEFFQDFPRCSGLGVATQVQLETFQWTSRSFLDTQGPRIMARTISPHRRSLSAENSFWESASARPCVISVMSHMPSFVAWTGSWENAGTLVALLIIGSQKEKHWHASIGDLPLRSTRPLWKSAGWSISGQSRSLLLQVFGVEMGTRSIRSWTARQISTLISD